MIYRSLGALLNMNRTKGLDCMTIALLILASSSLVLGGDLVPDDLSRERINSNSCKHMSSGGGNCLGTCCGICDEDLLEVLLLPANVSVLKDLIAKGVIDIESEIRGLSLLAYSAAMGNQQALSMLVEMGADLSFRDEQGRNVLFHALASGSDESVQIIETSLTKPAPDTRNCDELMYGAVIGGNVRWVNKLIDVSCDVDVRIENNATLLMLLPSNTHPNALEVAEVLLESGLDPLAKDDDGRTALDIARLQGNSEFISLVERHISSSR